MRLQKKKKEGGGGWRGKCVHKIMDVTTLLQRQMELHGTLRRPPHTAAKLKEVHETMKELLHFFHAVRSTASTLRSSPETVFQCLMHIGMGGVVSFDKQGQDGAVPMHQVKVLARTNAIELEPRLRATVPTANLEAMVTLCKATRSFLRIKVEDGNDFAAAERTVQLSIDYLDFISAVAGNDPDVMFKFYMVEDEASLVSLLNQSVPDVSRGFSEGGTSEKLPLIYQNGDELENEVRRLAQKCASASEPVGDRLNALQTTDRWLGTLEEEQYLGHIRHLAALLSGPLSVCAAEKRSAICRQACNVMITIAGRTPAKMYNEGPLKVAIAKWCSVLVRCVFVTVSAIAQATDMALRALLIGSEGNAAALKNIVEGLESGTHPELRRKCLRYLALGVVASQGGEACATQLQLPSLAQKYMGIGDTTCRKMARALYITLMRFVPGTSAVISDKKSESLIRQEKAEWMHVMDDVEAFDRALFGSGVGSRLSSVSGRQEDTSRLSPTAASSSTRTEVTQDFAQSSTASSYIFDTFATLGMGNTQTVKIKQERQPHLAKGEKSSSIQLPSLQSPSVSQPQKTKHTSAQLPIQGTVKSSASLRQKISDASSHSGSRINEEQK